MIKLYPGTNIDFSEIDFSKCKPNKDFGQGFYLTDIKKQALEMAVRRCNFEQSGAPIVQEYEFDETVLHDGSLKIKIFDGVCPEWAEFILKNRTSRKKITHSYDVVVGPVADDGVVYPLKKSQIQLIINCDVEELVNFLKEDYKMNIIDAFDKVYNSQLYKKLIDTRNGLYIQSPRYQYEFLKEEI